MLRNLIASACFFALSSVSSVAQAAFVDVDWKTEHDSHVTLHQETGKEWLDLSLTKNMSINEVSAQLGAGGLFEGWRLPTAEEVNTLMSSLFPYLNIGVDDINKLQTGSRENIRSQSITQEKVESSSFRALFGLTGGTEGAPTAKWTSRTLGYYSLSGTNLMAGVLRVNDVYPNGREQYYYNSYSQSQLSLNSKSIDTGVYLVSDGGVSLSSKLDPSLNGNNPNAPVQTPSPSEPTPVPVFFLGFSGFLFMLLSRNNTRISL